jgi:hypothetical protein
MNAALTEDEARTQLLEEILLGCLERAAFPCWPGGDGLTVQDVVQSYPQAMTFGLVPSLEELLLRHPGLTEELRAFLSGADAHPAAMKKLARASGQ